jgi:hypothetical protein
MKISPRNALQPVVWLMGLWFACVGAIQAAEGAAWPRKLDAVTVAKPTPESEKAAADLGLGRWIWTTNYTDKQTCRLWRSFTIANDQRGAESQPAADGGQFLSAASGWPRDWTGR